MKLSIKQHQFWKDLLKMSSVDTKFRLITYSLSRTVVIIATGQQVDVWIATFNHGKWHRTKKVLRVTKDRILTIDGRPVRNYEYMVMLQMPHSSRIRDRKLSPLVNPDMCETLLKGKGEYIPSEKECERLVHVPSDVFNTLIKDVSIENLTQEQIKILNKRTKW